ncbi:MAG: helicase SNF2, partial [Rhodanobacter sp.]|nr:helicase SNF2 [Rhodanobacter sp.]
MSQQPMLPSRLHELLQSSEWVSNFDQRSLQRAADYVTRQRVTALQFIAGDQANACALEGLIRGSAKLPYRCRIEVQVHERWLTVDTDCSCPVATECKHAAAMLLVAANLPPSAWPGRAAATKKPVAPASAPSKATVQTLMARLEASGQLDDMLHLLSPPSRAGGADKDDMQAWGRWLHQLDTLRPTAPPVAEAGRVFGVLLRGGAANGELLVNPVWLRPGKTRHAALVDPRPLRLDDRDGPVPAPADGWST